jgi:hypothetical protein
MRLLEGPKGVPIDLTQEVVLKVPDELEAEDPPPTTKPDD